MAQEFMATASFRLVSTLKQESGLVGILDSINNGGHRSYARMYYVRRKSRFGWCLVKREQHHGAHISLL